MSNKSRSANIKTTFNWSWVVMISCGLLLAAIAGNLLYSSHQAQSHERNYAKFTKKYFAALYGEANELSKEVNAVTKSQWSDFSDVHQGVKHLTLVTKYCENPAETPSLSRCHLSYQTHFNDGTSTMTYGMAIIGDKGVPVTLEPLNIEGGTMLLTDPSAFITQF